MRLPWRLFISYAVVIVIGAAVAYVTVRLLAPTLFDHQMTMLGGGQMGMGMGPGGRGGTAGSVRSAFVSALTTALLVGVLASAAGRGWRPRSSPAGCCGRSTRSGRRRAGSRPAATRPASRFPACRNWPRSPVT